MIRKVLHWRTVALALMLATFSLNVYIFLTLSSSQHSHHHVLDLEAYPMAPGVPAAAAADSRVDDSRAVFHLQAPRRRFNKSNFTSDSVGADVVGVGGGEGGGGAWEDGQDGRGGGRERPPHQQPALLPPRGAEDGGGVGVRASGREAASSGNRQENGGRPEGQGEGGGTARRFTDPRVDAWVRRLENEGVLDVAPGQTVQKENYWVFLRRQRSRRKQGYQLPAFRGYRAVTNWEHFHKGIRQHSLYDPDSAAISALLGDLSHREIIDVEQKDGGTQIKLIMTYDDEGQALFKPMRFPRETQTLPDHFYFADYERHIAEIAAFHLDRVLGYNRVPPVTGRVLNATHDIKRLADSKLAKTFFISPAGNTCFHGHCSYYCDSGHPVCGHPELLEASAMAFLPPESMARRQTWRNPWKRSYSKHRKAYWEAYDDLCERLVKRPPYNSGRRLLDIIDMAVLDFFMGNLDRHHYETFRTFGNDTFLLHLDNGRGFGKHYEDDLSCLAPLLQCCRVRQSTLQRLVRLYSGPHTLSELMEASLSRDPVSPVLIQPHLAALDRRLLKILQSLQDCTEQEGRTLQQVVIDDGVY